MKKFIIRLLIFCCLPLPVLYLINYMVDAGLKKSHYGAYAEWNDILTGNAKADMVIMGSSRAWVHFSPKILDSALHVNSYNLGYDGSGFGLQFKKLKIYLQHNPKPKYIVQEVGYIGTLRTITYLPGVQAFLPYLDDTAMLSVVQNSDSKMNFFDIHFPLYKYNNELVIVKEGLKNYFGHITQTTKYKGYEGRNQMWDSSFAEFKKANPDGWKCFIDSAGVHLFKDYLQFCKANGIKVILVFPPVYNESLQILVNLKDSRKYYEDFSKEFGVPFYNYENDTLNKDRKYFYNSEHLNKLGSEIFSREFANDVRKEIQ